MAQPKDLQRSKLQTADLTLVDAQVSSEWVRGTRSPAASRFVYKKAAQESEDRKEILSCVNNGFSLVILCIMSAPTSVKPFGLSQVYLPRGEPTVDIVFVHGLSGHPHDSWTSKSTNCFWPVDLLPDVLAALRPRILTYGYNAAVTAFTDGASRDTIVSHAETLASSLAANRNVSVVGTHFSPI